jgi:phosphatidylinositol 4-kinase type 2
VFKPKDEEPYASRNPKWTKWIHRNLFPCFFGRECLIPNLSYVSEAAAYVLDCRLQTNLVPYTDIVYLSSKSFYYDFWQRSAFYRKGKALPEKPGSFQVFLKGFKDANVFLRDNPWPDHMNTGFRPQDAPRRIRPWRDDCRPRGESLNYEEGSQQDDRPMTAIDGARPQRFAWTEALQQSFREELEKLVILDYIMRNTDRGLDNWMIKVDWQNQEVSIASEPPKLNGSADPPLHPVPIPIPANSNTLSEPYKRQETMTATSRSATPLNLQDGGKVASVTIGAIDNSLSWPWKHPDAVSDSCCHSPR